MLIPVPAFKTTVWSGAVLVMVKVPLDVIGLPDTLIPVPAVAATLETVPLLLKVVQSVDVKSPRLVADDDGILKVCVSVRLEILKSVPELPVAKY